MLVGHRAQCRVCGQLLRTTGEGRPKREEGHEGDIPFAAELDDVLVGAVKHAVGVLHLAEVDQLERPLDALQGHVARSAAANDRFARPDTAELTIELDTMEDRPSV